MKTVVQLQLMAQDEIMQYVPPETHQKIIAKDEHPLYRAYCIGEEGKATPNVIGIGGRVLNWMRAAISAMVQKLQYGTKIFHNHAETNDHQGRTVIGELVGKALEYVDGKLRAVAVTYIYPQYRKFKADAASIEAEIELDPTGRSNVVDGVHVLDVTGIAVGDSAYAKPAFPAAGLIAQLQAFDMQGSNQGGENMGEELTIERVKAFLKAGGHQPSAVFDKPTLLSDPLVGDHVLQKLGEEYGRRREKEDELNALKKTMPEKMTKLENDNKDLRQTIATGRAKELMQSVITERKLEGQKGDFIKLRLPQFKVEGEAIDDAAIKDQVNKFIDSQIDEFDKLAPVFNPKPPASAEGDDGKGGANDKSSAEGQKPNAGGLIRRA
jgi:hypothetical protein